MTAKIVYADDEVRFHKLVKMFLREEKYEIETFTNGMDVIDYLSSHNDVDLVLLDVMMPELNGWETCREIQQNFQIPVIMITALDDENSEVHGMDLGADDYISKPFSREILASRVRALLRRTKKIERKDLEDEGIALIESLNSIRINNRKIILTPKEFDLLKYMIQNKNIVLTRDSILNHVWGMDYYGDPRTVDTHIKSLRAKLDIDGKRIKTVRKKGYCYSGENK
jgi:two-component system, OmpR family, response regulator ResD